MSPLLLGFGILSASLSVDFARDRHGCLTLDFGSLFLSFISVVSFWFSEGFGLVLSFVHIFFPFFNNITYWKAVEDGVSVGCQPS